MTEPNVAELPSDQRKMLAKKFIEEVVLPNWLQLQQWGKITIQTSQIDSGYIGQHLVSLVAGVPGTSLRGKGEDLADGSEIKNASTLDAVDIPRWNIFLRDEEAFKRLFKLPVLYLVLFDHTKKGDVSSPLRFRIWAVHPGVDTAFRKVVSRWYELTERSNNFQLHPPVFRVKNIATNENGNLGLPLIFHAEQVEIRSIHYVDIKTFRPKTNRRCRLIDRD